MIFGARFEVSLREGIGYDIATGLFEYRNLDRFLKECTRRRPAVFADVGANIGLYTCAANGFATVDLGPGQYRFTIATATGVYASVWRVPS